jgi:hypothetical protein
MERKTNGEAASAFRACSSPSTETDDRSASAVSQVPEFHRSCPGFPLRTLACFALSFFFIPPRAIIGQPAGVCSMTDASANLARPATLWNAGTLD